MREVKFFSSPLVIFNKKEFLNSTINVTDKYIEEIKHKDSSQLIYHSQGNLYNNIDLYDLHNFVGNQSFSFLDRQGFDMDKYELKFIESWVQEFNPQGYGSHRIHVHPDAHVSGFFFLKCSDKTSYPTFHDPRPAALMNKLILKQDKIVDALSHTHYYPVPGDMVLFNSYLPHEFNTDRGVDPFRFMHFNLRAKLK